MVLAHLLRVTTPHEVVNLEFTVIERDFAAKPQWLANSLCQNLISEVTSKEQNVELYSVDESITTIVILDHAPDSSADVALQNQDSCLTTTYNIHIYSYI